MPPASLAGLGVRGKTFESDPSSFESRNISVRELIMMRFCQKGLRQRYPSEGARYARMHIVVIELSVPWLIFDGLGKELNLRNRNLDDDRSELRLAAEPTKRSIRKAEDVRFVVLATIGARTRSAHLLSRTLHRVPDAKHISRFSC